MTQTLKDLESETRTSFTNLDLTSSFSLESSATSYQDTLSIESLWLITGSNSLDNLECGHMKIATREKQLKEL